MIFYITKLFEESDNRIMKQSISGQIAAETCVKCILRTVIEMCVRKKVFLSKKNLQNGYECKMTFRVAQLS